MVWLLLPSLPSRGHLIGQEVWDQSGFQNLASAPFGHFGLMCFHPEGSSTAACVGPLANLQHGTGVANVPSGLRACAIAHCLHVLTRKSVQRTK